MEDGLRRSRKRASRLAKARVAATFLAGKLHDDRYGEGRQERLIKGFRTIEINR